MTHDHSIDEVKQEHGIALGSARANFEKLARPYTVY